MSAQKDLQESENELRELLEEQKKKYFPNKGSLICPPGKSVIFYKKETKQLSQWQDLFPIRVLLLTLCGHAGIGWRGTTSGLDVCHPEMLQQRQATPETQVKTHTLVKIIILPYYGFDFMPISKSVFKW